MEALAHKMVRANHVIDSFVKKNIFIWLWKTSTIIVWKSNDIEYG
jgi:hypothetical protein